MGTPSPEALRAWLEQQRLRHGLQLFGVSFLGAASGLLVLFLWSDSPALEHWFLANLALLLLCLAGSWSLSERFFSSRLARKHPELAESLRTLQDLESTSPSGPEFVFFREQHRRRTEQSLQGPASGFRSSWKGPFALAVLVQCLWFAALWWVPGNPEFLAWRDGPPVNLQESYRLLYPSYLNREPLVLEQLPERLSLPQGTRLEILAAEAPEDRSRFEIPGRKPEPLRWFEQQGHWMTAIAPDLSGTLILQWKRLQLPVEVVPDQAPELLVIWPSLEHIFDSSPLPVDLSTSDDHALLNIIHHYQVELTGDPYREIIQAFETPVREHQELYIWELSGTPLKAGDNVTAWIEVSDRDTLNGPHIARSQEFRFQVESLKEFHERLLAKFWKVDEELRTLLGYLDQKVLPETALQEEAIDALLEEIQRDMVWDLLLSDALKNLTREMRSKLEYYREQRQLSGSRPS